MGEGGRPSASRRQGGCHVVEQGGYIQFSRLESGAAASVLTPTWEGDSSNSLQLLTALADGHYCQSQQREILSNTSIPKTVGLARVGLSDNR